MSEQSVGTDRVLAAMVAAKALDAEVAEKVFAYVWRRSRSTGNRCIYAPGKFPEHMEALADGTEPLVTDWGVFNWTPLYSTVMSDAWRVVEKMRADGWRLYLDVRPGEEYRVMFARDRVLESSHAETAPLAICRAAILALSHPDKAPFTDSDAASSPVSESQESSNG